MTTEEAARVFDAKAQINTRQQNVTLVLPDLEQLKEVRELLGGGQGGINAHDPKHKVKELWRWQTTRVETMETILDNAQPFLIRLSLRAEELREIIDLRKQQRERAGHVPLPRMRP
jgi:hypothetical protein